MKTQGAKAGMINMNGKKTATGEQPGKERAGNEQTGALYPIRTVSELTGVNAITLRAWESRYGLIEPVRKASGHRLYTQDHINLINQVVGLLDRGMRIGQVKPLLDERAEEASDSARSGPMDPWQSALDGMLGSVIRFDENSLEEIYNEALSRHDIRTVTRKLMTPLLARLGERWESGMGSIAEEHFFGFYLRNKLGAQYHHRLRREGGDRILMACLPGERHEVGLLMFGLAVGEAGMTPIILGADTPLEEIPATVNKTGSKAVVLSSMIRPQGRLVSKDLAHLVSSLTVPVFLGGLASVGMMDELDRAGVHVLGTDIDIGIQRLRDLVAS
jgi:DNA-binding transcriptional MerR regulator